MHGCLSHVLTTAPCFPTSKDSSTPTATTSFIHLYFPQTERLSSQETDSHSVSPHSEATKPQLQKPNKQQCYREKAESFHSNMPETLSLGQIVVKLMSKLLSIQEVVTIRNTLHRCEFCLF